MSAWLILLVGAIYTVVAINLLVSRQIGLAIAFAGYAFSNIGLWMAAK